MIYDKGTEIITALKFLREDGLIKSEGTEKFSYIKPKPKPVKKPKAVKAVTYTIAPKVRKPLKKEQKIKVHFLKENKDLNLHNQPQFIIL